MGGGILVWPRASGPRELSGCLTRFVRGGLLKIDMKMRQITHYHETDRARSGLAHALLFGRSTVIQ